MSSPYKYRFLMTKIILDLCGGTGSWSKPYKDAGYDVRIITLPDYDVTQWENYPEVIQPVTQGKIYGILSAPPCTEFSIAKGNKPRDFISAMRVVRKCLHIIWQSRISGKLKFWALENPTGLLRQFLGKPALTFQPWWYGDFHTKKTDLWGYFNEPKRKLFDRPLLVPMIGGGQHAANWDNKKAPPEYRHLKLNRAAIRAITPKYFSLAFFKANQ